MLSRTPKNLPRRLLNLLRVAIQIIRVVCVSALELIWKILLQLSQAGSLIGRLLVYDQLLSFGYFSSSNKSEQLSSFFKLFPQFLAAPNLHLPICRLQHSSFGAATELVSTVCTLLQSVSFCVAMDVYFPTLTRPDASARLFLLSTVWTGDSH
jgi:hypothetical protein